MYIVSFICPLQVSDMYNLMEATRSAKSIAVIGGGFLGTELAVGLAYRGKYYLFPYRLLDSLVV